MAQSSIEWTEMTWNPVTGCSKVSSGCTFCYAEVMAKRLKAMGIEKYSNGFEVALHEDALLTPYSWKKPRIVFVNSMSDLFHEDVPLDFIKKVFETMNDNAQHIFQVLTKRTERLKEVAQELEWGRNIWMGVSVESPKVLARIDDLRETPAHIKFLSCEPLIRDLGTMDLEKIDWVIVGGESGHKARPMKAEWVHNIQQQCQAADVAFFFKQWGGKNKKKAGRELNGRTYDEMPAVVEETDLALSA